METIIKPTRTQEELIKYLLDSKKQMLKESEEYFKSSAFIDDMKKLKQKQKQNNGL